MKKELVRMSEKKKRETKYYIQSRVWESCGSEEVRRSEEHTSELQSP